MIVPPPPPAYTLSPALEDIDDDTIAVIERCVAALTGQVGAVVVIGVGATEATSVGPVFLMELMDSRPFHLDSSPEPI